MLTSAAMKVGFSGGLVVDFPHSTRAKKFFLVLMVGSTAGSVPAARGLDGEDEMELDEVKVSGRRSSNKKQNFGNIASVSCLLCFLALHIGQALSNSGVYNQVLWEYFCTEVYN